MENNYARDNSMNPNIAIKTAAKSFFRELKNQGFNTNEIINLSGELLHMVSSEIRSKATKK